MPGSRATRPGRRHPSRARTAETKHGCTCITPTSSRCRTNGNTRGTRRGTLHFIACRWRRLIRTSPRSSSFCCFASGTCIPTGSFPRMNGRLATSIHRCTRGPRGACTRSSGVSARSAPLPEGGHLEQSDGTSWMGMYCLNMLAIALELAKEDPAYEDVASKFFEHFVHIAHAMNDVGGEGISLWDEEDGFYYDVLNVPGKGHHFLKVRSMVGLIPLFAVETLEPEIVDRLPGFKRRMQWFIDNHPDMPEHI